MKPVRVPARIDDPPHFLLWSADEMAPIMIGVVIGVIIKQFLICTAVGFAVTHVYRKFRDSTQDGYIVHWLYHIGMLPSQARTMLNSYITRLFP